MQPSTAAICVIAGAVAVDCLWIAWESWHEKKPPPYAGYTGSAGFVPRVHDRPPSIVELIERLIMTKSVHIRVHLDIAGWPVTGHIECEFIPCPPPSPIVTGLTGSKGQPMITFTATVSNIDPAATTVPYTASFDDGSPPQTFDVLTNGTFTTAGPGVTITLVGTQSTAAGGISPPSVPVSFLAAVGVVTPIVPVPPLPPAAPTVTQITGV